MKTIVLDDKWQASIFQGVAGEVSVLTRSLVARIEELGERYAATAAGLAAELMSLEKAVARHLADMGVSQ